jgi:hypothetical protein
LLKSHIARIYAGCHGVVRLARLAAWRALRPAQGSARTDLPWRRRLPNVGSATQRSAHTLRSAIKRDRDWSGLAVAAKELHIDPMSKSPRVTFKYNRIAEDDWQIEAHCPGSEIRYIKPFKSKAEIDEWLQGSRRIDWLRSQGYAK